MGEVKDIGTLVQLRFSFPYSLSLRGKDIKDPEHPYSLEELKVITEDAVELDDAQSHVRVTFTPTVEHCSMATIIGLCLRVKLMRSLPSRYKVGLGKIPIRLANIVKYPGLPDMVIVVITTQDFGQDFLVAKVDIRVAPGTHATEAAVNKQLSDKERVAAALENPNLVEMVDECLAPSYE
ncbi:hypothetical protein GIB67_042573 [Kingdonia uniflora]|uniref:MIP18 family-like domain-containing protein n=1 Tax=Kingdonia uniflora TaxID=39325 RepID=A0A7J7M1D3_9MAGN|nr:hypothetical protein GIB67_042573 [Kingdonia uniflora]